MFQLILKFNRDSLFVAIKGDKFDGHDFVDEVVKKGAAVVLINGKTSFQKIRFEIPVITVRIQL